MPRRISLKGPQVKQIFRLNNFDLLRLIAALQVAIHHAAYHFEVESAWWSDLSQLVPGVPIFFFVSGFLISKSYESNSRLGEYALNRGLRIFPALWVCTLLALVSVWKAGYFDTASVRPAQFAAWVVGQLTFVQFFNPDFMRNFGSGVLNGSLWTITVELQFYVLIPILYAALRRLGGSIRRDRIVLLTLIALFIAFSEVFHALNETRSEQIAFKLTKVTFAPWFYMFLIGVLVQRDFALFHRLLANRALVILPCYAIASWAASHFLGWKIGNQIHPAMYLVLVAAVFSAAYSAPSLSERLLHKNDISYGVYIYHIPIINLMMFNGCLKNAKDVPIAVGLTLVAATLSWLVVERPAIRRKKRPLQSIAAS